MVNVDDYDIDSSGESSEDEDRPKRPIPLWARSKYCLENGGSMLLQNIDSYLA